jgi:hypothetical protein
MKLLATRLDSIVRYLDFDGVEIKANLLSRFVF